MINIFAILATVTLSIGSASDYKHIIPTETNLLTNVGMGESAPNDYPINYTDKAFLSEAFLERIDFFLSGRTKTEVDYTLYSYDIYNFPDGWGRNKGYVTDERTNSIPDTAVIVTVVDESVREQDAWKGIFGVSDPFMKRGITNGTFSANMPIMSENIKKAYSEISKLFRPAYYGNYVSDFENCNKVKSNIYSTQILYFDSDAESFVYGEDTGTNIVERRSGYACSFGRIIRAGRQKDIGWAWDSGSMRYVKKTSITPSDFTTTEENHNYPIGSVYVSTNDVHNFEGKNVSKVTAFGFGYFNHEKLRGPETIEEHKGYFVVPLTATYNDGKICVQMGEEVDTQIRTKVFTAFGARYYTSASELLSDVPQPENPSLVDYADNRRWTPTYKDSYWLQIDKIYVILEVTFNARVLN